MITGVSALSFVSIVGCVRLDVPEKILFGDLSRQMKKVLDWRSLDNEEKTITQLGDYDIDSVVDQCNESLHIYVREYDSSGDY